MSTEHDPPEDTPLSGADDPLVSPRSSSGSGLVGSAPEGEVEPAPASSEPAPAVDEPHGRPPSANMLPQRERRRSVFERLIVRLIATFGIIAVGVAIAAIMVSSNSQGWIVGLVVSAVTVVLAALLWSSRTL